MLRFGTWCILCPQKTSLCQDMECLMWYLVTTLTNSEAHEYQRKPSSIKQARRIRTEIHDLTGEIRQNNPPLPGQQISAGYICHHQETLIRQGQCLMYSVISAAANSVAQQTVAACKKQDLEKALWMQPLKREASPVNGHLWLKAVICVCSLTAGCSMPSKHSEIRVHKALCGAQWKDKKRTQTELQQIPFKPTEKLSFTMRVINWHRLSREVVESILGDAQMWLDKVLGSLLWARRLVQLLSSGPPWPLPFCEGGTEVKRSRQGLALISYQFPVKLTHWHQ